MLTETNQRGLSQLIQSCRQIWVVDRRRKAAIAAAAPHMNQSLCLKWQLSTDIKIKVEDWKNKGLV